ncbi:MAG TPA: ABC transporter permease [Desulfatiglandales bacterium]|nr:ABC transporter permease [Desulfatiglandales bacterium]
MNLINIKAIARKEYYHLIRDFRSMYLAFFIPLFLILMFGYALSLDVDNVKTVVVDHDRTFLSRDLVDRLDASAYFDVIARFPDRSSAIKYIDEGSAILAVIIPPGLTEDLRADRESAVQLLLDGTDSNFAAITSGYISAFIEDYNRDLVVDFINRKGIKEMKMPVDARIRIWFNEDMESRNFIVPGIIALIIMIVGAILTSLVIAREYENGTMETILSLPVSAGDFFIGKALPYFFIGIVDTLIAILMGQILFGVVIKGSFWLMVLASTVYIWTALGLGLLLSVTVKSQLVANQMAIMLSYLPSLLLSDFVFPVDNMPMVLRVISRIVPARYFIDILNGLYLRDLGFGYLWFDYLILLIMCIVLANLAFRKLRKEGL